LLYVIGYRFFAVLAYFSTILTIALPTITPSAYFAISFACSGVDIPNPTAHGCLTMSDAIRHFRNIGIYVAATSGTPIEDTQ
jgi:hypothetical protein